MKQMATTFDSKLGEVFEGLKEDTSVPLVLIRDWHLVQSPGLGRGDAVWRCYACDDNV
jgi:hypothetical protein